MKDGKCPKCGSGEVYTPGTPDSGANRTRYVCTACGYLESYIEDNAKLAKITEKWQRASS